MRVRGSGRLQIGGVGLGGWGRGGTRHRRHRGREGVLVVVRLGSDVHAWTPCSGYGDMRVGSVLGSPVVVRGFCFRFLVVGRKIPFFLFSLFSQSAGAL